MAPTYSAARTGTGPFLFVSGQMPTTADGEVPESIAEQTRVVLDAIADVLREHGAGWPSVVKLTYYLRDIADLGGLREVIVATVPPPRPAATLVEVSGLVDPRFRVEIDAVADLGAR